MCYCKHRFWFNATLISLLGLLLAACASHTSIPKKQERQEKGGFLSSSACMGNAYLQKYACSIQRIEQAAQSADPDAQYALGYIYYYGIGTVQDKETARLWIQRAAKQGQPLAKKAEVLMNNGAGLHSLHSQSDSGSRSYGGDDGVEVLNSTAPDKPLNDVLPNYGKPRSNGGASEAVIQSLQKESNSHHAPSDSSPTNTVPATEPLTKYKDPRLAPNASPITETAQAKNVLTVIEQMMMQVPKKYYTLQLMGGRHLGALKNFIKTHNLSDRAQIYSANLNHEKWYMLIYGNYPSVVSARMASHELPASLRALHPWIKSYRIVHDEIYLRRIVS